MLRLIRLLFCLLALTPHFVSAQTKVETIVTGLNNPTAIAIQPETGTLFIAESGAGRVVRIVNGKAEEVIDGSTVEIFGKGPLGNTGPLGLAFQDRDTLVVSDGGFVDGEELVRVFTIPAVGKPPVKYNQDEKAKAGPLAAKEGVRPVGTFFGLVATKAAIYVTGTGDDNQGWIARSLIDGTKLGTLDRLISLKPTEEVSAPAALAVDKGGNLLVGQMGEINKPKDAVLTFYSAKTTKPLLNLETGLYDLTGIAYSPKTGLLYVTDLAWMEPKSAGLFRIDADLKEGVQAVKTLKIASLERPTSLTFAPDGTAYITQAGAAKDEGTASGSVVKIAPGL